MFSKKNEASVLSVRELCLYALLGALIFALKMAMAPLPNIEPVTLLMLLCGRTFCQRGLWICAVYVACEFLVWGIGPWSAAYLYVWPLIDLLGYWMRSVHSAWFWALMASLCGFGFGAACALPMLFIGGWSAAISWWQAGVLFDLIHGFSNFALMLLLYRPLGALLEQLKIRIKRQTG